MLLPKAEMGSFPCTPGEQKIDKSQLISLLLNQLLLCPSPIDLDNLIQFITFLCCITVSCEVLAKTSNLDLTGSCYSPSIGLAVN